MNCASTLIVDVFTLFFSFGAAGFCARDDDTAAGVGAGADAPPVAGVACPDAVGVATRSFPCVSSSTFGKDSKTTVSFGGSCFLTSARRVWEVGSAGRSAACFSSVQSYCVGFVKSELSCSGAETGSSKEGWTYDVVGEAIDDNLMGYFRDG